MPASIIQATSGGQLTAQPNATFTLPAPAVAGSVILAGLASDAYATAGAPTGFTESTGCRQHTFHGAYLWWKVAVGGEQVITKPLTINGTYAWGVAEIGGLTVSPYDVSNGQLAQSSANTYTTPSIVPTAGERFVVAQIGGSHGTLVFTGMDTWLNSYAEFIDQVASITGASDELGLSSLSFTADGVTGTSSGSTYTPISAESRTGIIISFKVASGEGATPSLPPQRRRPIQLVR